MAWYLRAKNLGALGKSVKGLKQVQAEGGIYL